MATLDLKPRSPSGGLAPRVVLLLDGKGLVVSAKRTPSKSGFDSISDYRGTSVHDFLHPDCASGCDLRKSWGDAWTRLQTEDFVEWELNDRFLDCLLRFNLTWPPSNRAGEGERRRRSALLTVRDITKYRTAHESLRRREEELVELVREQGLELASAQSRLKKGDKVGEADDKLLEEFDRKIRSLSHSVIMAQENERKRIASDLHDGSAQSLTMLKFGIEASIEKLTAENSDLDLHMLESIAEQTKRTVEEVRRISQNLAPTVLDDFGLQVAVEWLCEEVESRFPALQVECSLCTDAPFLEKKETTDPVSIALYRVAQEGLHNATKHAEASLIKVAIENLDGGIVLTISDDGVGFSLEEQIVTENGEPNVSLGLCGMRERVSTSGGLFEIDSEPGRGTTIRATWSRETLSLLTD